MVLPQSIIFLLQVNEVLEIESLFDTTDDEVNPPTGTYGMCCAVAKAAGAITGLGNDYTIGPGAEPLAAGGMVTNGLTYLDFGTFRTQISSAISTLDRKIDEILAIPTLSC